MGAELSRMIDHRARSMHAAGSRGAELRDRVWVDTLLSFEFLFALSLYSNAISFYLAFFGFRPPVDETLLFAGIGAPVAAWIVWQQGLYLRALPLLAAYLLFVGWTIFSMGWSPSRSLARETVLYELTFLLWALCAAAFVVAMRRERVARFLVAICLISATIALVGWTFYFFFGSFKSFMNEALSAEGLGHARAYNRVGYSVAFGAVVLFVIASFSRFGSARQIGLMLTFMFTAGFLLVAGSRGAFLSAAAGCLVVVLVLNLPFGRGAPRMSTNQLFALVLVGTSAMGVAIATGLGLESTTLARLGAFLFKAQNVELIQGQNRFDYFKMAVDSWMEHPIIGLGNSGFNTLSGRGELTGHHPHNIILEVAANYGSVGILLFILFLWTAFHGVTLNRLLTDRLLFAVFAVFVTGFVAAQGSQQLIRHDMLMASLGLLLMPAAGTARAGALPQPVRRTGQGSQGIARHPVPFVRTRS